MSYSISKIEGIGPAFQAKLAEIGIKTTAALLERGAKPKGRKELAEKTGIPDTKILKFVNMADLMRIKGVGEEYSDLLEASGVDTVKELKTRKPDNLTTRMAEVNAEKKLVRRVPTLKEVTGWIAFAKTLDAVVTY